jgi:endo-1,4-beta-mannosidase
VQQGTIDCRWCNWCDDTAYRSICSLQKAFKEYVGAVILHKNTATGVYYRDDPTILGWEIANAPVCPGDDTGDLLQVLILLLCGFNVRCLC